MKAAFAIALFLGACSSGKADSEAYIGLVQSPATNVPAIEVGKAASDPGELYRAVAVPHRQVGIWLGAHRFRGTSHVTVTDPVGKAALEDLTDQTLIDFDGQGFHATLENSKDYGRHAWLVDGALYLRPRFGAYHKRAPSDRDEAGRIRDDVYGTVAAYLEPFAGAMKLADGGVDSVGGRPAHKIIVSLASEPKAVPRAQAHRKWREHTELITLAATIHLDDKTGVPLKAALKGSLTFEQAGKRLLMTIEASHEISDVGAVEKLLPPTDGEILTTPVRARETDDRNTLLRGIAPPARRSPTPENVRPEGSPS